jgi:hypothetical protein
MAVKVTWQQALALRMQRHLLDPIGTLSVARVVRRLCGVQAQVASSAELAVRVRREVSRPGEVGRALSEGRIIKTWAMRGTLHLLAPEDGGAFLSLIAAGRPWARPSWQRYFGVSPEEMDVLRHVVREALDGTVLTRDELVTAVIARRGLGHIGDGLRSGWGTLLKPLAWQGDLCFGPNRGNRVTFKLPEFASSRWTGVPDPDEAAPVAIATYVSAYGPTTVDAFGNWLSGGWFGKRQLRTWFTALGDRLAEVQMGRSARTCPGGGPRRAGLGEADHRGATTAGLRPVRDGSRHRGRPRRSGGAARSGEQAERLDLASRGGGWRCVRHLGTGWRTRTRRLVQGGWAAATEGPRGGSRAALLNPRSPPPRGDQPHVALGIGNDPDSVAIPRRWRLQLSIGGGSPEWSSARRRSSPAPNRACSRLRRR